MKMTVRLPWPPSANTYWRHVGARVLISEDGRIFRQRVIVIMRVARLHNPMLALPLLGPVALDCFAYPPDRRRRDLDNMLKATLDALTHAGTWGDDSQIDDLRIRRGALSKGSPYLDLIITN